MQLNVEVPAFQVGQAVAVGGKLFRGEGKVVEVREDGISVKCPAYIGEHYGSRAQIKYDLVDLAAGKVWLLEAPKPAPIVQADAPKNFAAMQANYADGCGDQDEDEDYENDDEGENEALTKAATALVAAANALQDAVRNL